MATKVKLRSKSISNGRQSLYLDFYPPIPNQETGKLTRREFLNLYINDKPKSPIEKQHNIETTKIAESIRQKRENFLNKPEIYSEYEKEHLRLKELSEMSFLEYFKKLVNNRKGSNQANWKAAFIYLNNFTNGNLKFSELNEAFLEDYKNYLLTTKSNKSEKSILSQNSAVSYFNKIKATLKQAYKEGKLQEDLNAKISPIKEVETRREFLTIEELNKLSQTPCDNELLKRVSLFSAITGMAFKEIQCMIWKDVSFREDNGYLVLTKRQKTQRDNYLPISDQAYSLMGEPKKLEDKVFYGLKYLDCTKRNLSKWFKEAGIEKEFSFHSFRHTFATIQLLKKTDIYTVSKMLGHKDLKTTQIYAKIVDQSKREAANKIQLKF